MTVGVIAALWVLLGWQDSEPGLQPVDAPLSPPDEPTMRSVPLTVAAPDIDAVDWLLGVQAEREVWLVDPATGETLGILENLVDATRRGDTVLGRRDGELVLLQPGASEKVWQVEGQQIFGWVSDAPTMAVTPRPVLLVPTDTDGDDLSLTRFAIDGSLRDQVALPGCGFAYPIAARSTDRVLAVWCSDPGELRAFVDRGTGDMAERRWDDIPSGGDHPIIAQLADFPLFMGSDGIVRMLELGADPTVRKLGDVELAEDEVVGDIGAAIMAPSSRHLLMVGVSDELEGLPDVGERWAASRLVGFDIDQTREIWTAVPPVPVEMLVGAPDGSFYGYRSAQQERGGDHLRIDPATGAIEIVVTDLASPPGRLSILPRGILEFAVPVGVSKPTAPSKSEALPVDGRVPVYLMDIDARGRELGVDVVVWLSGEEATAAYLETYPNESEGPPNDYFIVNESPAVFSLFVSETVDVRLVRLRQDGDADLDPGTWDELGSYLSGYESGDERLSFNPFWLELVDGVVVAIEEQYTP